MPTSPLLHTDSEGRPLYAILSLQTLHSLDADRIAALRDIGIHTINQLLHWDPVHHARTLMAIAQGEIGHDAGVSTLLDAAFVDMPREDIPSASTVAIHMVGPHTAQVLSNTFGVTTIAELASFGPFLEAEAYLLPSDLAFREPFSAPVELIPRSVGAVTSSVRFSSFVREVDLRHIAIHVTPAALTDTPIGEVFTGAENPVIYLGYVAGHIQRWNSRGTHLGEVIHSLPLAPGESRNVTIVDWKRRQFVQRGEDTTVREQVDSTQVHKRALDEVARAVAEEHQYGKTSTESNTAVTSGSFVATGAVVGGVAGGVVGAIGGGVTGLAIDTMLFGTDAGAGTIAGTIAGGAVGAIAGGAAGAAAGGLIYSGATAIGLIESSSEGDREIVARTHQEIMQSTVQKSSAIRSLWSTIVVEDAQSEQTEIRTTNVTNYNHMHALTVQYYEVLQHYRTTMTLSSVRPLLFLPFRPLPFTFAQIQALWSYLEADARAKLPADVIERAFATLPPPPEPELPGLVGGAPMGPDTTRVTSLRVRTETSVGMNQVEVLLRTQNGSTTAVPFDANDPENSMNAGSSGTWRFDHFRSTPDVPALNVSSIRVRKSSGTGATIRVRIQYTLTDGSRTQERITWKTLDTHDFEWSTGAVSHDYPWGIAAELTTAQNAFNASLVGYEQALAAHEAALAAHQGLVDQQQRAREELEQLFRWRRYEFTRAILQQTEPQQLTEIFEEMELHVPEVGVWVPLHRIAHTVPVGTTGSSFVFELKRNAFQSDADLWQLFDTPPGFRPEGQPLPLIRLSGYAHSLLTSFETESAAYEVTENVYLPTSGVFAEAILGRSNAAEKLDITRFFNWQDSPIPNPAPPISAADPNAERNVDQTLAVTTPGSTINLVNPVTFPDPSGLSGVLQAVQNGSMFRDMSKADELKSIVASLSTLAAEMGKASSQMAGDAAEQALKSATDVAKAVAALAQTMQQPGASQKANSPTNLTEKGATIAQLEKLLSDAKAAAAKDAGKGGTSGGVPGTAPTGGGSTESGGSSGLELGEILRAIIDALGVGSATPIVPAATTQPGDDATASTSTDITGSGDEVPPTDGQPSPTPPSPSG